LRHFPDQVLVLKGTKAVTALDARAPGIATRMIVARKEGDFRETVRGLEQLECGDPSVIRGVLPHNKAAFDQMEKALASATGLAEPLAQIASVFERDEISILRRGQPLSQALMHKILALADHMAARFFRRSSQSTEATNAELESEHLHLPVRSRIGLFRRFLDQSGSQDARATEKVRNDLIDMNFAVYGTYFNGLMSGDKRALRTYFFLARMLDLLGARVPPHYLGSET
jgi:hypothetical protein